MNNNIPINPGLFRNTNLPFHPFQYHLRPSNSNVWRWQFTWDLNFQQFNPPVEWLLKGVQFPILVIRRAGGSNAQF